MTRRALLFLVTLTLAVFCSTPISFATVTNTAPTIECPDDIRTQCCLQDILVIGDAIAGDPDGDPIVVTIKEVDVNGVPGECPPGLSIDPDGLNLVWDLDCDVDEADYLVTLEVTDGFSTAECQVSIILHDPYQISIGGGSCTEVLPGYNATINVSFDYWHFPPGGFDFLISYDNGGGIYFLSAMAIGDLAEYWEYFTYRFSEQDNCEGGCPSGMIRLIGIYDMPNGEDPAGMNIGGDFVELTFGTSSDYDFLNQCFWLDFAWFDCGDNTISSLDGNKLFMAMDIETILPDLDCLEPDKYEPIPCVRFNRGCICIRPPEDARGDINLNGVANEISDAVLFANYFIYGPHILGYPDDPYWENRKLATDINDDGVPLTVADLVYLIRIVTGDANPYPESGEGGKVAPLAGEANVSYTVGDQTLVQSQSLVDVGAAAFVFRYSGLEVGVPVLTDETSHMTIGSSDQNGELRILVYSMENESISIGASDLFTVPMTGEGTIELVEVQYSDARGNVLAVNTAKVAPPTTYALLQNYPNPFNAGTMIRFALPGESDWNLRIYNIVGQLIKEFSGHSVAGYIDVRWDAVDAASGVYFYKLTAGDFTDTKKMTLMK